MAIFSQMRLVPTLFVDPWGYKGLTLQLINSVLKDCGCDTIIFFNYNRINMGLSNLDVQEHMSALFTEKRVARLRVRLETLKPLERELAIVEDLANALMELGAKYVLPFGFKNEYGTRTSHHLIFVTKNFRGYEIIKGIMARQSSAADQGVPSFTYNPADSRFPLLFELSQPLDDLGNMLLKDFAGRSLSLQVLYEEHSVGRPYILKNYRDALRKLEYAGKIRTEPPAERRRKIGGRASWHQFQLLTKRSERLLDLAHKLSWPSHVWMGVSVENEDYTCRIDHLRRTPAKIKFLSLEPLLGPLPSLDPENIHWVIVGGESGPGARPIEVSWVIDIRNQCRAAGVPFFFKQWGGVNKKRTGRKLEGRTWDEMPLLVAGNKLLQSTLFDV